MRISHGHESLVRYQSGDAFTSLASGACHRCQTKLEHIGMMMRAGKEGYR
jgi:hypothetical protein